MFALIRRDFMACRFLLIVTAAVYVLYAATTLEKPIGFFTINIGMTLVLCLLPLVMEEKYSTDILVCYLPPLRRTVVFERYILPLFTLLTGLALQVGVGAFLGSRYDEIGFSVLRRPQAILLFCAVPVLFVSLFWPCIFRFGLAQGAFAFLIVLLVLAITVISPLLTLDFFSQNGGLVVTREMMQHPEQLLVALVDHAAESTGYSRFYQLVFVVGAVLVAASVALSVRFFQRRDM